MKVSLIGDLKSPTHYKQVCGSGMQWGLEYSVVKERCVKQIVFRSPPKPKLAIRGYMVAVQGFRGILELRPLLNNVYSYTITANLIGGTTVNNVAD